MLGSIGDNRAYTDLHFLAYPRLLAWDSEIVAHGKGMPSKEDAMPVRRTIGISLACLLTAACAIGNTPEEGTSHDPGEAANISQKNAGISSGESHGFPCGVAQGRQSADYEFERIEQRAARSAPIADACDSFPDPCCGRMRTVGNRLFGKAVWYDLVGGPTASGEILDRVTATAAHRSLPLASFAKVTNLDNGRSVIVKINDRGPYTRGRILDLSPRAADVLDMKRAGVVPVVLEPLDNQTAPTVAALQTSDTATTQ